VSVSSIDTFNLTNNELVATAFNLLGAGSEGEPITARMYADGTLALNLMIKTWSARPHLWTQTQGSLTMIANQAAYVLPGKPMRVISARRKYVTGGMEIPLRPWSRQEYLDQPNKTNSPSTPVNFYYDPQRDTGTIYLWPAPSDAVAPTITIEYDYLRRLDDMLASNNNADLPTEWLEAIAYNLAVRLMPQYPVNDGNQVQLVIAQAQALYEGLKGWDNEPTSIFLQPDYQGWGGGYGWPR